MLSGFSLWGQWSCMSCLYSSFSCTLITETDLRINVSVLIYAALPAYNEFQENYFFCSNDVRNIQGLWYNEFSVQLFVVSKVFNKLHRTYYCSIQLFLTTNLSLSLCVVWVCVCAFPCVLSVKEAGNVRFKCKTLSDTIECQPTMQTVNQCDISRVGSHACPKYYLWQYCPRLTLPSLSLWVCVCVCAVSYTHLTLPTRRTV